MFLNVCFIYTFKYGSFIAIDPPKDLSGTEWGERHACATRISL